MLHKVYHSILPEPYREKIYSARRWIQNVIAYGGTGYTCDVCGKTSRRFKSFDLTSRSRPDGVFPPIVVANTICPWCGSNLRHRLFCRVVLEKIKTAKAGNAPTRILHFAPEKYIRPLLQNIKPAQYFSTDFIRPDVDFCLDMTQLGLSSSAFDVIVAIHVLEHIPDDRVAMKELYRVLRVGGWAALMVPVMGEHSHEDPRITSEDDRVKYYGQNNHVLFYGMDFAQRLRSVGFEVEVISYRQVYGNAVQRNLLHDGEGILFIAHKSQRQK